MDEARKKTDRDLLRMEKKISKIYRQAQKEITEKWNNYMKRGQKRLSALYDSYKNEKDPDKKAKALQKYQDALHAYTFENKRYKDMINETTLRLANVNKIALAYINGKMPRIYTINYNQIDPKAIQLGIDFTIVDEGTVERLIKDGDIQLPYKTLNISKDQRWNTKKLNSSLLQGILQGESIVKIAQRILPIISNNENAAIRNARTMVTGAENKGRLDRYYDLEERGAILTKVWIATGDSRTRDWHAYMDGQEIDIHAKFTDGLGNRLEYPGDPSAPPATVYNCRCSMKTHILGIRKNGRARYI